MFDNTLLLEDSAHSYKQDTVLDLNIIFIDDKFVTAIHRKVDDFNFEVITVKSLI